MKEKSFTIIDSTGIHARPATLLVNAASRFESDLKLAYNGKEANLKSIMGVMALAVPTGATIKILANGPDADAALVSVEETLTKAGIAS